MKELTVEMLASAKTTIPTHSPTNRGTWRKTLCLLSLAALSLTINSCGGGNDSPQTAQQIVAQLVQQGYLKASNTVAGDLFGYSVALAGDTLAVGVPGEDSASGAVYVFTRIDGVWSQQAYVKASNTEANDGFGESVALAGDTLAVGAPGEDSDGDPTNISAVDSGAVYIFTRSGSGWSQQAYVKASNTETNDGFGESVALTNDTLAVGAPGEDSDGDPTNNSAVDSGAVYVFTRSGSGWNQQAYVKASNAEDDDLFGVSVALAGDTLAVGAPGEDSDATGIDGDPTNNSAVVSGAVYIFTRSGSGWSQQAYVKASNTETNDGFGESVALTNDTLAVGAPGEDSDGDPTNNSAVDSGAVYVFTRTGSNWSQQAYLKASNTGSLDLFGSSIALDGDTLAVGALFEASNATGVNGNQGNNSAPDSGATYVFSLQ